jgi:hypothetical protein
MIIAAPWRGGRMEYRDESDEEGNRQKTVSTAPAADT